MKEQVTLSGKEQRRLVVLNAMNRGEVSSHEAADVLELSTRQVRRICAAYRKEGAAALEHGNRGRRPPNAVDETVRQRVVELAQTRYPGCNHVHLSELLAEREGIELSRSTVRRVLDGAGIVSPRTRRAPKHRRRRDRYPQAGMLLQIDGSPHDWLEGRGPVLTLQAGIDDATGEVHGAVFREREDAAGYLWLIRQVVTAYGIPMAAYHDRHVIFGLTPLKNDPLGRRSEPTQVERAFIELGIGSIRARSPQAKGRIERLFGTLQDRLVSELRLAEVATCAGANRYLAGFLPRFNERFAVPAEVEASAYRPLPEGTDLERVCCFKYVRTVAADNTVRFGTKRIQILPGRTRISYAHARVEVHERLDGTVDVLYQGKVLGTVDAPDEAPVLRARTGPRPAASSLRPLDPGAPAKGLAMDAEANLRRTRIERKPAADHPWRRGFRNRQSAAGWVPEEDKIAEQLG